MANKHLFPEDAKSKAAQKTDQVKDDDTAETALAPAAVPHVSVQHGTGNARKGGSRRKPAARRGRS